MTQKITDLPEYCQAYLQELQPIVAFESGSVCKALEVSSEQLIVLLNELQPNQKDIAYKEGKWTIAEVIGHLIDCERIFVYRAMSIARGEKQPIPGFDENNYVTVSNYHLRSFESIQQEYIALLNSTKWFFEGLTEIELKEEGTTSGYKVTPRTIGMLISAHRLHHLTIIKERYLSR